MIAAFSRAAGVDRSGQLDQDAIELRAVARPVVSATNTAAAAQLAHHTIQLTLGSVAAHTDTEGPGTGDRTAPGTQSRARTRATVLAELLAGSLDRDAAAAQLDLSPRQLRRLLRAFRSGGPDALRHGNAGRAARHSVPDRVRDVIVELARTRYAGLSQTQLTERLAAEHGIDLHRTTVRRILLAAGLGGGLGTTRHTRALSRAGSSLIGHRCLGQGRVAGCRCVDGSPMGQAGMVSEVSL